jgi:MFS family permease
MDILSPEFIADVLTEGRGLSPTIPGFGLAIGLLLWLMGSRGHRFWLSMAVTVTAGIAGLHAAPALGVQPLVAGLLMAVCAGALALALVRLLVFAIVGVGSLAVAQAVTPGWNEPVIFFLAGGLIGVVFFRLWVMALTSLAGTVLIAYCSLCLAASLGGKDVVQFAKEQGRLIVWGGVAFAFLGVIIQFVFERRRAKKKRRLQEELEEEARYRMLPPAKSWWSRDPKPSRRRAG